MNKRVTGIVLLVVIVAFVAGLTWYWFSQRNPPKATVIDFATCVSAGYTIMETDPRQCRTPEGTLYVEDKNSNNGQDLDEGTKLATKEFTSEKGVIVRLYDWSDSKVLTSPTTIKGEVPGNWSFEASFPVALTDWDGLIIAEKPAQLEGDWMTENYVPFSVSLTFETPTVNDSGSLILRKDNPSGLPENDDAVEITINYE
jgi:hypothetical protein